MSARSTGKLAARWWKHFQSHSHRPNHVRGSPSPVLEHRLHVNRWLRMAFARFLGGQVSRVVCDGPPFFARVVNGANTLVGFNLHHLPNASHALGEAPHGQDDTRIFAATVVPTARIAGHVVNDALAITIGSGARPKHVSNRRHSTILRRLRGLGQRVPEWDRHSTARARLVVHLDNGQRCALEPPKHRLGA